MVIIKLNIREISLISVFGALTSIGAFISIPIGLVPITMQTLFVILSGILLGSKLGFLSQFLYILLGLIGLPVFAGFSGGIQTIFSPSFGFIIGFSIAAYFIGRINEPKDKNINSAKLIFFSSIIGTLIIYVIGLPYMYLILNRLMGMNLSIYETFKIGCLLFIPGDIVKLILASLLGIRLRPIFIKRIYLNN